MLKVIIVEDETIIRNGLAYSVNWLEYGCVISGMAKDGKDGLELIRMEDPDVVITDIRMPHMSGLDMIDQAQQFCSFHSIILTSYADFGYAKKALSLKAAEYLLKPVDKEELIHAIEKIGREIEAETHYAEMEKMIRNNQGTNAPKWDILEKSANHIDYYVKKTYALIKEHYKEKLSINDAAEVLEISSSYLSRKLKQNLNTSFVDLLNQYRIRQAVTLLEQNKKKVYEISDDLGYGDYKQFSAMFKKYTELTPSDFIKKRESSG